MRELFIQQPGEEIRGIEDFQGYWASNLGRIISAPKKAQGGHSEWIVLSRENPQIILCRDKEHYPKQVHDLVCKAFHNCDPEKGSGALHLDSDKTNNREDNLIWGFPPPERTEAERTQERKDARKITNQNYHATPTGRRKMFEAQGRYIVTPKGRAAIHRHNEKLKMIKREERQVPL
jgi:hypothetical protein